MKKGRSSDAIPVTALASKKARVAAAKSGAAVPADVDASKRARILNEAARLFRRSGHSATTLRQIADAAGLKAGSIYYHFLSKEEILGEVMDTGILMVAAAVRERVDSLSKNASGRDRIAAAIEGHLYGLLHHGDFTSANIRVYGQIPQAAKDRHRIVRRKYAAYWDRLFADAQKSGDLRQDVTVSVMRLFVLGSLNWTVEWYDPKRGPFEAFSRHIGGLVFDGILQQAKGMLPGTDRGRLKQGTRYNRR